MPRVNNGVTETANRLVEKVIAIHAESLKYSKVQKTIAKLDPIEDAEAIEMQRDYLKKIEIDRASIATTILGMHEKAITESFPTFLQFARNFATNLLENADAEHAAQFNKMFSNMDESSSSNVVKV